MVQQGDFKVELVEATTKAPFLEHFHDGKTYVEVEPECEYFIRISKPQANMFSGVMRGDIFVDGKWLGYNLKYDYGNLRLGPDHYGSWTFKHGTSIQRALKFVIPKRHGGDDSREHVPIGKVEFKIFQGINPIQMVRNRVEPVPISARKGLQPSIQKKTVRTDTSGTLEISSTTSSTFTCYERGMLLSTITLYYCTTPGLVQMGVISGYSPPTNVPNNKNNDEVPHLKKESKRKRRTSHVPLKAITTSPDYDDDSVVTVPRDPKVIKIVDLTQGDCASDEE